MLFWTIKLQLINTLTQEVNAVVKQKVVRIQVKLLPDEYQSFLNILEDATAENLLTSFEVRKIYPVGIWRKAVRWLEGEIESGIDEDDCHTVDDYLVLGRKECAENLLEYIEKEINND